MIPVEVTQASLWFAFGCWIDQNKNVDISDIQTKIVNVVYTFLVNEAFLMNNF